jgi:hypothetical protein
MSDKNTDKGNLRNKKQKMKRMLDRCVPEQEAR